MFDAKLTIGVIPMITCSNCGAVMKNPDAAKAGARGGKAKVRKGFAVSKTAQAKAQATRRGKNAK
jgi:hypothetical protein